MTTEKHLLHESGKKSKEALVDSDTQFLAGRSALSSQFCLRTKVKFEVILRTSATTKDAATTICQH